MLKTALSAVLVCLIALLGGATSVAWVLASGYNFGAVRIGPWTSFPDLGTRDADPYAQAETARRGVLTLGRAEGVEFSADRDSAGNAIEANCAYAVAGQTPAGRFWTLRAEPLRATAPSQVEPAIHSRGIMRNPDNSFVVVVGRRPAPGNWLQMDGDGRMRLVLTIYDTSATAGPVSTDVAMPAIQRAACDA